MQSKKDVDLTCGRITAKLWTFAIPLMIGNVFQQFYNLVDTWVVGKYIGEKALAAVGSSYTLMTFLTSIVIGLCMGNSAFISIAFGRHKKDVIKNGIFLSFISIGIITLALMIITIANLPFILNLMNIPADVFDGMIIYTRFCIYGFVGIFLYNYISNVLRGIGNSIVPLYFLGISVVLNIILDISFVGIFDMNIWGAALATVISQSVSGVGISIYFLTKYPQYHVKKADRKINMDNLNTIMSLSGLTCLQQSVMNFGILMVQGIVNSFGTNAMAAFAVAVKIDTIAYMPVQDFGNAFSVFVAQNYGAQKIMRIKDGIKQSILSVTVFCVIISGIVCAFARNFMDFFVEENEKVIDIGAQYLRIEGSFYIGIGILFILYGFYRGINKPLMSVILTIISLGTRVALAYVLSGIDAIGLKGIWVAIPIGWILADFAGLVAIKILRIFSESYVNKSE